MIFSPHQRIDPTAKGDGGLPGTKMVLVRAQVCIKYDAPAKGFLSVAEHEIVTLKEMQTDGYYLCESFYGQVGWVPASAIKRSTPLRALADFAPAESSDDEVSLTEGIIVFGFKREGDWWYGESMGTIGWFPATYCETALEVTVPVSKAPNPARLTPETTPRTPRGAPAAVAGLGMSTSVSAAKQLQQASSSSTGGCAGTGGGADVPPPPPPPPVTGKLPATTTTTTTRNSSASPIPGVLTTIPVGGGTDDARGGGTAGGKAEAGSNSAVVATGAGGGDGKKRGGPLPAAGGAGARAKKDTLLMGLWAHNMGLASAVTVMAMGPFAILWTQIAPYHCLLQQQSSSAVARYANISSIYIKGVAGNVCQAGGFCCDPSRASVAVPTHGSVAVGWYCLVLGPLLLAFENTDWGYGLRFPSDAWYVRSGFPLHALLYLSLGIYPCFAYPTVMGGVFMIITAIVYYLAVRCKEVGDGGRAQRSKTRGGVRKPEKEKDNRPIAQMLNDYLNPYEWCKKVRDEDMLGIYVWVILYFTANLLIFFFTYAKWEAARIKQVTGLTTGTLKTACTAFQCKVNQAVIKFGPISTFAPWAKACGNCLNFNCALILMPIVRMLLRYVNNVGTSFSRAQQNASIFARLFAHPMTRYLPLSKNIAFHKMIAIVVLLFTTGHTIFHWLNYWKAPEVTLARFAKFGWGGTTYLTGAMICLAMFFIYTAASNQIRFAKYEVFFGAHHWFIVFFVVLLVHGPVFYAWSILPIVLYVTERYLRIFRGNRSYIVNKVEWIPPVMAIQFRPEVKDHFRFKEGQYLYLNCPYIDQNEWHPFTISSAQDDLYGGPRISLETGEEVVEVPRPKDLPAAERWAKFCPVSKDWRQLTRQELLDKHETGYNDYVSVHVKVHGLEDPEAVTWTRRLKEYFELMNPSNPFPYYFRRRDERGDIQIGKRNGPDGRPILRVDGPHSAPSEHYCNYNTCMIVGAGIGLTPCSSILTALLKYRWRKNFKPELLHFYWVVRQDEVDAFQWFIHHLADLEYRLKGYRQSGAVGPRYYVEINIYITSTAKTPLPEKPMRAASKTYSDAFVEPAFTAQQLYSRMLNPTVKSSDQIQAMADVESPARLQDVWVWNGRPDWDAIFANMKRQRQHPDIGVCFCGTPVIGRDLKAMCRKYSSAEEDCIFTLHKEQF